MKKIFSTTDIDRFFTNLKEQSPIYNEEKVHQIINSPKAAARLKGKYNNLLKITIMTTIIAVIISAVLLWPGENSKLEVSDSNKEVSDSGTEVSASSFQVEPIEQASESIENTLTKDASSANVNNDEMVSKSDFHRDLVEPSNNNQMVDDIVKDEPTDTVAEFSDKEMLTDIDTFEPVDGNPFIITADKTLLKKLGFQFKGENVFYQNKSSEGIISALNFMKIKHDYGTAIINRTLNDKILEDSIVTSTFDFYPVITSYLTGQIKSSILNDEFNFESVNDTLFPLHIPHELISDEPNDILLWFKTSGDFFNLIPENNHPLRTDFDLIKRKKEHTECNLIKYEPQIILNQSRFIELSDDELLKIGFYVKQYNDPRPGKKGESFRRLEVDTKTKSESIFADCAKNVMWNNIMWEEIEVEENKYVLRKKESINEIPDLWLSFTSNTAGVIFHKINVDCDSVNFIPIKISKHSFDNIIQEDILFWFQPTDYLFEQLPERISTDLRKEYNYIIAEDKSALEKPECKYFDECKNTLEITDFKAFPNPATYEVSVSFELPKTIEARISLVDLTGREKQVLHPQSQFAAGKHQLNFDLSSVPEGMYLITLYSDKGVQTKRLMVVK